MMMPARVAMALQADGADEAACWAIRRAIADIEVAYDSKPPDKVMAVLERLEAEYLEARGDGWNLHSEIVWHKPNPMPESVIARPTSSHEKLFLLSKSGRPTHWLHEDGHGSRTKPEPDYKWINRVTDEVCFRGRSTYGRHTLGEAVPAHEQREADPTDSDWIRRNRWRGRDYFYDAEAVRSMQATERHKKHGITICRNTENMILFRLAKDRGTIHRGGQPPQRLEDPRPCLQGRSLRHLPAGAGRAVHQGGHLGQGRLWGVRRAVGAAGGQFRYSKD